jgi:hypothetical protein
MSIDLEHDKLNDAYYLHDYIDGWRTIKISRGQYYRWKKQGVSTHLKWKYIKERGF